jgi:hypothetical protein
LSPFLDEGGVYQVVHGKLVAIEPEIVNWRTGGVIKNAVTLGIDKGHVNGTVAGPRSKKTVATTLGMAGSLVFYIRCPGRKFGIGIPAPQVLAEGRS